IWSRPTDDQENVEAGRPPVVPAYVLDTKPEGLMPTRPPEMPDDVGRPERVWHLYGPEGERHELTVIVEEGAFEPDTRDVFDLAGRRAYRDDAEFSSVAANSVVVESEDMDLVIVGGADADVLDDIAAATTFDGGELSIEPGALPDG